MNEYVQPRVNLESADGCFTWANMLLLNDFAYWIADVEVLIRFCGKNSAAFLVLELHREEKNITKYIFQADSAANLYQLVQSIFDFLKINQFNLTEILLALETARFIYNKKKYYLQSGDLKIIRKLYQKPRPMHPPIKIAWQTAQPQEIGYYIVAASYDGGLGNYDYALWNGDEFELTPYMQGDGFIACVDFVKQLNLAWPKADDVEYLAPRPVVEEIEQGVAGINSASLISIIQATAEKITELQQRLSNMDDSKTRAAIHVYQQAAVQYKKSYELAMCREDELPPYETLFC